ncbi:hypothetical protein KIW84_061816 [Lathyrus oleraceus]|uniref:Uncharacterized protein n=1 Tax=Pisum sativum TaxID=3888 RepID=A0A9D5A5N9_PEA|nr:hypothetical protein KIW84_061816 [Pisum sativum]
MLKSIIRARDKGVKFELHWSAEDQLIEPNGSMLASYIGFLVRQHIPITCDNWRSPDLKVAKKKYGRDTGSKRQKSEKGIKTRVSVQKGRTGYARLQQRILAEEKSDATSLPEHVLWKAARVGKDGLSLKRSKCL